MTVNRRQLIKEIKDRVENIPQDKLDTLLDFVKKLESEGTTPELLSYFGLWSDMDDEMLTELTTDLPQQRLKADLTKTD